MKKNIYNNKNKNKDSIFKSMPLSIFLFLSITGVSLFGALGMIFGLYQPEISLEHPFVVPVLVGNKNDSEISGRKNTITDGEQSSMIDISDSSSTAINPELLNGDTDDNDDEQVGENDEQVEKNDEQIEGKDEQTEKNIDSKPGEVEYVERAAAPPRSQYYDDPRKTPLSTDMNYVEVADDYFEDALFVGDSRIEGLAYYGGIENAEFVYKQGASVWNLFGSTLDSNGHGKTYLESVIKEARYTKIYIMLGINELGDETPEGFKAKYSEIISTILTYQPNARIFIFGIMNMTKEKSNASVWANNDNINARNCRLAELSNGSNIVYLDMNVAIDDGSGAMNPAYTSDGVHLRAEYHSLWTDFIKKHGLE